jgi:hypothetical protein
MTIYSKDELNLLLGIEDDKYDVLQKINEKMKEEIKWIFGTMIGHFDYSPIQRIILISSKGDIIFIIEIKNRKSLQKTISELEVISFTYEEIIDDILDNIFYERRFEFKDIELSKDDLHIKNLQKFIERKISKNEEEQLEIKKYIEKKDIFGINRFLENIIINIDRKLKSKKESYDKDSNIFSISLPSISSSNNSSPSSSSSNSSSSSSNSSFSSSEFDC